MRNEEWGAPGPEDEGRDGDAGRGWEAAANVAGQVIRQRSGAGRFATAADVRDELEALDLLPATGDGAAAALAEILEAARAKFDDLTPADESAAARRFYSTRFMTAAYAGLLLRTEGAPLPLIAETVRENSSLYPRPLPLGAFQQPPFALTREEILECLARMESREAYRDIARTRTSAGNEYLYSTVHLDPDYAASLAEWIDVGQYENP
jgi:hypothetical protein